MKTKTTHWLVALCAVALLATGSCKKKGEAPAAPPAPATAAEAGATAPAGDEQAWYICPMAECHYAQKGPGKCPKCGMDLTPAAAGWLPSEGAETGSCTATSCGCPMTAGAQAQAAALAAQTAKELAPEKIGQQATCPVTGETFTVTEATPAVAYEGKTYLFCCMGCVPKFLAEPAKYAAAAAAAPATPPVADAVPANAPAIQTAQDLAPEKIGQQATCPVSGETFAVSAATPAVRYEGQVYLFCCAGCPPKFLANPQQYGAPASTTPPAAAAAPLEIKTASELAPERLGQTETCPIGGDTFTVAADTPAVSYAGKVVLFGCMGCANAFAANPANPTPPSCPHHGAGH